MPTIRVQTKQQQARAIIGMLGGQKVLVADDDVWRVDTHTTNELTKAGVGYATVTVSVT